MISPGYKSLGTFTVTTAGTQTGDWVENLDGALSMLADLRLSWGSGGSSIRAYIQGSADQGTTVFDMACVLFGAAAEVAMLNFSALTPKITQVVPTDGALADDTAIDGLVSDRVRLKLVTTGTYAGSTVLSGSIVVR